MKKNIQHVSETIAVIKIGPDSILASFHGGGAHDIYVSDQLKTQLKQGYVYEVGICQNQFEGEELELDLMSIISDLGSLNAWNDMVSTYHEHRESISN